MDKNVEAQRIANKYLETEISDFQVQVQSISANNLSAIREGFLVEIGVLEGCFKDRDYSHIDNIIDNLLPFDFKLNTSHIAYETLRYEFFQARIRAIQEMIEICNGPYLYDFKGENIDLRDSLMKFFAKKPAVDKWNTFKTKKTQMLVNTLADEIRSKFPNTNVTSLAAEIAEMERMKNSENPISYDTIRKDYLDDYK